MLFPGGQREEWSHADTHHLQGRAELQLPHGGDREVRRHLQRGLHRKDVLHRSGSGDGKRHRGHSHLALPGDLLREGDREHQGRWDRRQMTVPFGYMLLYYSCSSVVKLLNLYIFFHR